jgi:hypothetical protein
MSEFSEPRPNDGGFVDSKGISTALTEFAQISRLRSDAHDAANMFRDLLVPMEQSGAHELRAELGQAEGVLARWAIMAAHQEFRTVDLARVENGGDWDATSRVEREIGDLALELFMDEEIDGLIERDSNEARLSIIVDPNLVSASGLYIVRRKRMMLATKPRPVDFVDVRPTSYWSDEEDLSAPRMVPMRADAHTQIDKVSEFVLDAEALREFQHQAAWEVRQHSETRDKDGKVADTHSFDATRISRRGRDGLLVRTLEAAITKRHPALTPAVTTYYADRKYKNIREAEGEVPQVESEPARVDQLVA